MAYFEKILKDQEALYPNNPLKAVDMAHELYAPMAAILKRFNEKFEAWEYLYNERYLPGKATDRLHAGDYSRILTQQDLERFLESLHGVAKVVRVSTRYQSIRVAILTTRDYPEILEQCMVNTLTAELYNRMPISSSVKILLYAPSAGSSYTQIIRNYGR